ncbi:MAG: HEPN domain-containing protein [Thermoplasmata archaeon]
MTVRTRYVDKSLTKNYLKKAEESMATAKNCLENKRWNSAAANAVHCGISACDALTVFMVGARHASEKHEDAIALFESLNIPKDVLLTKGRQLGRLLAIKNAAEYEDRLISENDAIQLVKDAERFLQWVTAYLKT